MCQQVREYHWAMFHLVHEIFKNDKITEIDTIIAFGYGIPIP